VQAEPLLAAALLLSPERACYAWVARAPETFRRLCEILGVARLGGPVLAVALLFGAFKVVQSANSPIGSGCSSRSLHP